MHESSHHHDLVSKHSSVAKNAQSATPSSYAGITEYFAPRHNAAHVIVAPEL
jgi:hypothetical protein